MGNTTSFLFAILFFSSAFAATIYVNGSAPCYSGPQANYSTIQAAVNAANGGDTIIVCSNATQYTENVLINKSLNVYGNQSGVLVRASNASLPVFTIIANFVNLTNFTLMDGFQNTSAGVLVDHANNSHIYNINATDNYNGFWLNRSNFNTLSDNIAYMNNQEGYYIEFSDHNAITGNTARNNTWQAFMSSDSSFNTFVNNSAFYNRQSAYVIMRGSNTTLINNLEDNFGIDIATDGLFINSDNCTVIGNLINNTGLCYVVNGDHNTFIGNTANNCFDVAGFSLASAYFNTFINNTATNNRNAGFYIYLNSSNNTFIGNTAINNTAGFNISSGDYNFLANNTATEGLAGFAIASDSRNNIVSNNTATDNIVGISVESSSYNAYTFNSLSENLVGMELLSGNSNNISNNTAANSNNYGFFLISSNSNAFANNTAFNNSDGFYLESSSINTFNANAAYDNTNGFTMFSSPDNTFNANTVYDNTKGFNNRHDSNHNAFSNNTAHNNSDGFFIESSSFSTLTGNSVRENANGFNLIGSPNGTFTNNLACNNTNGFYFSPLCGKTGCIPSSNNNFTNNTACNNTYGLYSLNDTGRIDRNTFRGNTADLLLYNLEETVPYSQNMFTDSNITFSTMSSSIVVRSAVGEDYPGAPDGYTAVGRYIWLSSDIRLAKAPSAPPINLTFNYNHRDANMFLASTLTIANYSGGEWTGVDSNVTPANRTVSASVDFGVYGLFGKEMSGAGGNAQPLAMGRSVSCPGDAITVTVTSGTSPVEGAYVKIYKAGTLVQNAHTDRQGKATFILQESASYDIEAEKAGYDSAPGIVFQYTICQVQIVGNQTNETRPQCTNDLGCAANESCDSGACVAISPGACGYFSNHSWIDYDCCSNSDCVAGARCEQHSCVLPPQNQTNQTNQTPNLTQQDAQSAIGAAQSAMEEAGAQGRNITDAGRKLQDALSAYDSGNYLLAKDLAEQAKFLAQSAQQQQNTNQTATTPLGMDLGLNCLPLLLIAIIALAIIYWWFRMRKSK